MSEVLDSLLALSNLSALIAAIAYGAFAAYFGLRLSRGGLPVTRVAVVFLAALVLSTLWAALALVDGLLHWSDRLPAWVVPTLDVLRFGGWFAFMLLLLPPPRRGSGWGWIRPLAAATLLAQLALVALGESLPLGTLARPQAFAALAIAVLGLVIVEQMLRNATGDARWNAKQGKSTKEI